MIQLVPPHHHLHMQHGLGDSAALPPGGGTWHQGDEGWWHLVLQVGEGGGDLGLQGNRVRRHLGLQGGMEGGHLG